MCGIIAYVGSRIAKPLLLEGLRALEYRGYDSAGFALLDELGEDFEICRRVGPVQALVDASGEQGQTQNQGIAHTRWATHGVPSETNAHPHRSESFVLVHNGIIENHSQLREELLAEGYYFESQTDTEVFAQLLEHTKKLILGKNSKIDEKSKNEIRRVVLEAVQSASKRAQGHYSVILMVRGLPGEIFGLQQGAPLVMGHADHALFVASDIQAVLPHTQDIGFINPGHIFEATAEKFSLYKQEDLSPATLEVEKIDWSPEQVAKDGFETFMLKEIFQQPLVTADTLSGFLPKDVGAGFVWDHPKAHRALWKNAQKLTLIACGTSRYAAMTAKYFFERWARLPVEVDLSSEFKYRDPIFEPGTVYGFISQSGETADTLSALRMVNERGPTTFSICNVPGSSIMREAHFEYPTKAGPEVGVASTKAFTAQLTVLLALALDVAKLRAPSEKILEEVHEESQSLARLPHDMEKILARAQEYQNVGAGMTRQRIIMFLGRGPLYPISLEGSLKLKEITYYQSDGYAAGELKHGPLALVDEELTAVILAPTDKLVKKTMATAEELKSRKAHIVGIGEEDNKEFRDLCDEYIAMPPCAWSLAPLLYVIPLQLIAYGLASELGREIDKPRNLAKSVTVE